MTPDELRERRKAAGLTQAQLAEMSDVAVGTVRNLERGRGAPRPSIMRRLERGLSSDAPTAVNDGGDLEIVTLGRIVDLIESMDDGERARTMTYLNDRYAPSPRSNGVLNREQLLRHIEEFVNTALDGGWVVKNPIETKLMPLIYEYVTAERDTALNGKAADV